MRKAIGSAGLAAVISMGLLAAFPVMAWAAPVLPEGISAGSQSLANGTKLGQACALSVILLLIITAITVIQMRMSNRADDWR